MMKSPCAVLVRRITPKISDWLMANRAYSPPSSTPCTIVATQLSVPDIQTPKYACEICWRASARDAPVSVTRPS